MVAMTMRQPQPIEGERGSVMTHYRHSTYATVGAHLPIPPVNPFWRSLGSWRVNGDFCPP